VATKRLNYRWEICQEISHKLRIRFVGMLHFALRCLYIEGSCGLPPSLQVDGKVGGFK
jgi:hypothetical protein